MSSANKTQAKNPFLKSNKNIEINMSTLSTAQKQMCLKLLAQSNINFEEAKEKNCFQAELKIDPSKLTSQFTVQKQTEPNVSPIKLQQSSTHKRSHQKAKQNQHNISNITFSQKPKPKAKTVAKQPPNPIYTSSKKSLSKTVKLNSLTELETLYPTVQLYVYPKKIPFHSLIELIEEIYDLYWNSEINKQKKRQPTQQKEFSFDTKSPQQEHIPKHKYNQTRHKSTYIQQKQSQTETKSQQKKTFCHWVFTHFILSQKQKMKVEQLMVNLVESLNHFSYKHLGIQMFYNFLSGAYNLETLNYYLVVRALLQQIEGEKIIEKVSSYGSKAGVLYKMKLNPYNKVIEEEKVFEFLEVCCQSTSDHYRQDQTINKVFQQMTEHMFFDEKKKKNFINFFEMVEFLLREFLKVQTVNTTHLQLSYTQDNSEMNDLVFQEQLNAMMNQERKPEQDLELTFEVHQQEENQEDEQEQYDDSQQNSGADLNEYLPNYYSRELEIDPRKHQQKANFEDLVYEELLRKYQAIRKSLSGSSNDSENLQSRQILECLFASVVKGDKKTWTELMANRKVTSERQSQELHFIQKLQIEFERIKNSNIVSNDFLRRILTVPYLRQTIVKQAGISFSSY